MRRLAFSFCTVVALLVVAAGVSFAMTFFPPESTTRGVDSAQASEGRDGVVELVSDSVAVHLVEAAERERRSELLEAGIKALDGLVLDGSAASRGLRGSLIGADADYSDRVRFVDQRGVLVSGCELAALTCALNSMGYDAVLTDIADHHLRSGIHVATDYLGSPYVNGGGLPPCIVDAANSWLASRSSAHVAHDLTGTSFDVVATLAGLGFPVVTWTTIGLAEPRFTGPVEGGLQWYSPEHCVVVYGVEGDQVLVSDSLEGLVKRDRSRFEHVFAACGNKAMAVL